MGELPLYELKIDFDDETGVDFISLVDRPAIEIDWQAFNQVNQSFEVVDNDKRIIAGFAMVANQKIYRNDGSGEYNVFFSKDTITQIIQKFFKGKKTDAANIMHTQTLAKDTYIIESFQIDTNRGIVTPKGFAPQEDGSWFISMKVDDDKLWKDFIKKGKIKAFSIEGIFDHVRKFNNEQMNKNETLIKKLKDVLFGEAEIVESKEEVVEETIESKFEDATLADGTLVKWEGELAIGTALFVVTEEGDIAAPDGEHELSDGSMLVVTEGGIITEIIEAEAVDIEEVMSELMRSAGVEFASIKSELTEIKNENAELKKQLTEFKAEVEKDLNEKNKTILELGKQEIVAPVQKATTKPIWKKY